MQITIANKQRALAISIPLWRRHMERLTKCVFDNLMEMPSKHLTAAIIRNFDGDGHLSVALVNNRAIARLNRQWRGKDGPTDVLSFPYVELEGAVPDRRAIAKQLQLEVGEVVISLERARQQAEEYGHSLDRELAFLFVHGLLHVLGFDHETPDEEKDMFSRQKKILAKAGFNSSS